MKTNQIQDLILENGRRHFNATDRKSKDSFLRRQRSLYTMLIQQERYEQRKHEEAVQEALDGA